MPIFGDGTFSIVPAPTTDTVTGTTPINGNTDITYLNGSVNTLPAGTTLGQKKLMINVSLNAETFSPLASNTLTATDVDAVAVADSTTVYIGGNTLNIGAGATNIVAWNPVSQTYSSVSLPSSDICYVIIAPSPTNVIAGIRNPNTTGGGLYQYNGVTWSLLGGGVSSPGTSFVYALYYDSVAQNLYVGGDFQRVNNNTQTVRSLAVYNTGTSTWSTSLGSVAGGTFEVKAIVKVGTKVFVGGNFTSIGGTPLNSIGYWDTGTLSWNVLGPGPTTGIAGTCNALGTDGTYLYVGGAFTSAGGVANTANFARYHIASNTWSSITPAGVLDFQCSAITVTDTDVYIGGSFNLVNGVANTVRLARWNLDGETWNALGIGITDGNNCTALATDALKNLYIGGDYGTINGQTINNIAYYSSTNETVNTVTNGFLRNASTYTTLTFKRQYSVISLCWNGTEWVIVEDNQYVIKT